MTTQKAVQITAFNLADPAEAVQVVDAPIPEPGEGEVLVRLTLRPINPADIFSLQGVYPGFAPSEPRGSVPGLEGTGVVHKLGPGATKFKEGQRVVAAPFQTKAGHGTWQQYALAREEHVLAVPDGVGDAAAASFFVNPVTVYGFFDLLKVPKGEYLLSNAAASALGRMVIQLGKHYGVKTINLVRSARHVDDLKRLGADEVIVTTEEDLVARVKEITGGKGAYGALECVGGEITKKLVQAMRNGGDVLLYGAMDPSFEFRAGIPDVLFRGVTVRGFWLNVYLGSLPPGRRSEVLGEVMGLLEQRVIQPHTGERFPLERVQDAVRETQAPQRGGKCYLEG